KCRLVLVSQISIICRSDRQVARRDPSLGYARIAASTSGNASSPSSLSVTAQTLTRPFGSLPCTTAEITIRFPLGRNVRRLISDIEQSRAKCSLPVFTLQSFTWPSLQGAARNLPSGLNAIPPT